MDDKAALIKLGTLSYNGQTFTRGDWLDYGGSLRAFHRLVDRKLIAYSNESRRWYPTTAGWEAIDAAYQGE